MAIGHGIEVRLRQSHPLRPRPATPRIGPVSWVRMRVWCDRRCRDDRAVILLFRSVPRNAGPAEGSFVDRREITRRPPLYAFIRPFGAIIYLTPAFTLFPGKADIYHALQACLIPLYPATASLTRAIAEAPRREG